VTHALADVLVIGFGNPGRLDDGLGPELAKAVERQQLPGVTVDADYQLTVEDAAEVARHDVVIFADADVSGPEPFWVKRIHAGREHLSFTSHSVEPQDVLTLAKQLFHAEPEAYLLGVRGYEFNEFGERLSPQAQANLAEAIAFVNSAVRQGSFREVRPEGYQRACANHEDNPCKTENT
jgi:hydrogenase maturation protease